MDGGGVVNWKAFIVVLLGVPLAFALMLGWGYLIGEAADYGGTWAGLAALVGPLVLAAAFIAGTSCREEDQPEIRTVSWEDILNSEDD